MGQLFREGRYNHEDCLTISLTVRGILVEATADDNFGKP